MATLKAVYNFTAGDFGRTDEIKKRFDENGYILIRGLFDQQEIKNVRKVFEETDLIKQHGFGVDDGNGKKAKAVIWNNPGNDVSGMMGRCMKVVNTCEALLGEEVYHYHGKLLYKDAFIGGSHLWHQDYGYWYKNSCLFPNMMTVFIAIDKCAQSNGCLEILAGSQRCGRIEHEMAYGQTSANAERVESIENVCPKAFVEMEPSDALFFHCNLLHRSGPNESPDRRWALLLAYNTRANNPLVPHHHAQYTPIQKVEDNAVRQCTNFSDFTGKEFMDPLSSKTSQQSFLERQVKAEET